MKNFETPLAITMGDPSGIGPEIILKSIIKTRLNNFVIFGDSLVFDSLIKSLGLPLTINKISELSEAIFEEDAIPEEWKKKLLTIKKLDERFA